MADFDTQLRDHALLHLVSDAQALDDSDVEHFLDGISNRAELTDKAKTMHSSASGGGGGSASPAPAPVFNKADWSAAVKELEKASVGTLKTALDACGKVITDYSKEAQWKIISNEGKTEFDAMAKTWPRFKDDTNAAQNLDIADFSLAKFNDDQKIVETLKKCTDVFPNATYFDSFLHSADAVTKVFGTSSKTGDWVDAVKAMAKAATTAFEESRQQIAWIGPAFDLFYFLTTRSTSVDFGELTGLVEKARDNKVDVTIAATNEFGWVSDDEVGMKQEFDDALKAVDDAKTSISASDLKSLGTILRAVKIAPILGAFLTKGLNSEAFTAPTVLKQTADAPSELITVVHMSDPTFFNVENVVKSFALTERPNFLQSLADAAAGLASSTIGDYETNMTDSKTACDAASQYVGRDAGELKIKEMYAAATVKIDEMLGKVEKAKKLVPKALVFYRGLFNLKGTDSGKEFVEAAASLAAEGVDVYAAKSYDWVVNSLTEADAEKKLQELRATAAAAPAPAPAAAAPAPAPTTPAPASGGGAAGGAPAAPASAPTPTFNSLKQALKAFKDLLVKAKTDKDDVATFVGKVRDVLTIAKGTTSDPLKSALHPMCALCVNSYVRYRDDPLVEGERAKLATLVDECADVFSFTDEQRTVNLCHMFFAYTSAKSTDTLWDTLKKEFGKVHGSNKPIHRCTLSYFVYFVDWVQDKTCELRGYADKNPKQQAVIKKKVQSKIKAVSTGGVGKYTQTIVMDTYKTWPAMFGALNAEWAPCAMMPLGMLKVAGFKFAETHLKNLGTFLFPSSGDKTKGYWNGYTEHKDNADKLLAHLNSETSKSEYSGHLDLRVETKKGLELAVMLDNIRKEVETELPDALGACDTLLGAKGEEVDAFVAAKWCMCLAAMDHALRLARGIRNMLLNDRNLSAKTPEQQEEEITWSVAYFRFLHTCGRLFMLPTRVTTKLPSVFLKAVRSDDIRELFERFQLGYIFDTSGKLKKAFLKFTNLKDATELPTLFKALSTGKREDVAVYGAKGFNTTDAIEEEVKDVIVRCYTEANHLLTVVMKGLKSSGSGSKLYAFWSGLTGGGSKQAPSLRSFSPEFENAAFFSGYLCYAAKHELIARFPTVAKAVPDAVNGEFTISATYLTDLQKAEFMLLERQALVAHDSCKVRFVIFQGETGESYLKSLVDILIPDTAKAEIFKNAVKLLLTASIRMVTQVKEAESTVVPFAGGSVVPFVGGSAKDPFDELDAKYAAINTSGCLPGFVTYVVTPTVDRATDRHKVGRSTRDTGQHSKLLSTAVAELEEFKVFVASHLEKQELMKAAELDANLNIIDACNDQDVLVGAFKALIEAARAAPTGGPDPAEAAGETAESSNWLANEVAALSW